MEVHPTPGQESFMRRAIESGRIDRPEAAALFLWEERERRRAELLADIEDTRASLARGEGVLSYWLPLFMPAFAGRTLFHPQHSCRFNPAHSEPPTKLQAATKLPIAPFWGQDLSLSGWEPIGRENIEARVTELRGDMGQVIGPRMARKLEVAETNADQAIVTRLAAAPSEVNAATFNVKNGLVYLQNGLKPNFLRKPDKCCCLFDFAPRQRTG